MQTNPVKAIREKCIECSCGSPLEVRECAVTKCPLYPFRFGKNPYRSKRELSEDQKAMLAHRLAESRKTHSRTEEENDA